MRVSYDEMVKEFTRVLGKNGITGEDADISARFFASSSRDGVYTHGLNRFPRYISMIKSGIVDVSKRAVLAEHIGMIERWDGQRGPGDLNAYICMKRAIELSKESGVGIVALRNTNHWMRPGNYGLMAAENDCIAILWTNTMPNMPAWGGKDAKIGNNPIVLAVPYEDQPVIVDVAMSMFSYGKLERYSREGSECPVDGGFDRKGNITRKPDDILETRRVLPMGYWKGSGLSIALDLIAASLSGGLSVRKIGALPAETSLSQVFIVFNLSSFPDRKTVDDEIKQTLMSIDASEPVREGSSVHYPGEGMMRVRKDSLENGVIVDEGIWKEVLAM